MISQIAFSFRSGRGAAAAARRSGERARPGCWRGRLADDSDALGETPRVACGTQALPGPLRFLGLLFVVAVASALPPPIDPPESAAILRIAGNAELRPLLDRWQAAFQKTHPSVRFEVPLAGSDVAMAALTTRRADVALLGREATAPEVKAFEWIYRYRPAPIEIATGSLGVPGRSPALVVFVHRDNPLAQLTLAQLDAAFGNERLRGASVAIRTWGALGLSGEWRDRPIHLYAPDTEEGTGRFFRSAVLNDSRLLAWENLREFSDAKTNAKTSATTHDAAEKILAALAADPLGLAVAGAAPNDPRVKSLALAASAAGPFIAATREHIITRDYPLARPIFAAVNRPPGRPLDPKVRDFLRYILSPAGQREIEREGGYLPLSAALLREQLKKLD